MPYVIAQKVNGREYYLENIDHNNHATWIRNKQYALQFEHSTKLEQFIKREFPNKNYYVSPLP